MNRLLLQEWINKELGSGVKIKQMIPLKGGISSAIYRLETTDHQEMVLRQFTNKEWLQAVPNLALREALSLKCAANIDIKTPQLIAFDEEGKKAGLPSVLMTLLQGEVNLDARQPKEWVKEFAQTLVSIHSVDVDIPFKYYTYNDIHKLENPQWSTVPALWGQAIELLKGEGPEVKYGFIHRDYHPTNVLWTGGKVSGVVDWVNGCMGPRGIDLGHCRLNLALLFGVETADAFLKEYLEMADGRDGYYPYWDLLSIIECLPGPPSVYKGWVDLGVKHLTNNLIVERIDQYLISIMKHF